MILSKNGFNLSLDNRSLLSKRKFKLVKNATPEELHVKSIFDNDIPATKYCFQKGFFTNNRFFIVDFYIPKGRICLEIDGGYHIDQKEYDEARDWFLTEKRGFRVIRVSNEDAMKLNKKSLEKLLRWKYKGYERSLCESSYE